MDASDSLRVVWEKVIYDMNAYWINIKISWLMVEQREAFSVRKATLLVAF